VGTRRKCDYAAVAKVFRHRVKREIWWNFRIKSGWNEVYTDRDQFTRKLGESGKQWFEIYVWT